jgi:hypothetical protein
MIWAGTLLVAVFNLLYLLIVFDVIRNPWFYIFTDVTGEANCMKAYFCTPYIHMSYRVIEHSLLLISR